MAALLIAYIQTSMLALRAMLRRQPEVPRGSGPWAKIPPAK